MTKPPPDDLKDWSKNDLIRELRRLRAILREHSDRPGDDPREAATTGAAITDVAGDPHAVGGVLIDMRSAVLLDEVDVTLVDTKADEGVAMVLALGGRINYANDRVQHAYLFGPDGAAGIVTELGGLAVRASKGPPHAVRFADEFAIEVARRAAEMP